MSEWQPIETAPKAENADFLIYGKHSFYGTNEIAFNWNNDEIIATHWMPLPKPPKN